MNRIRAYIVTAMSLFALAVAPPVGGAMAQQQSIKEQLAGAWSLVSLVVVQDEKKTDVFGENPRGKMILTPDGHFSTLTTRAMLPKFASNNRLKGTPDEYRAIMEGVNAHFGTYVVDEANKTITFQVEVSTFPNWDGQQHKRIFKLDGDVLSYVNPNTTIGAPTAHVTWKRLK